MKYLERLEWRVKNNMNTTKKVVLFIVEGKSDKVFFDPVLNELYASEEIKFAVVKRDITGDYEITTLSTIEANLEQIIKDFISEKKILKEDILKVVQIIDTDGASVPDSSIEYHNDFDILYSTNKIRTKYVEEIKRRNKLKKDVCNKLVQTKKIFDLHYEIYFMSCNLDHVLYDEQNQLKKFKISKAQEFVDTFYGKEEDFIGLIESSVIKHYTDYNASWLDIYNGNTSLRRATNINIYFKNNITSK